jgi:hypothetical protein
MKFHSIERSRGFFRTGGTWKIFIINESLFCHFERGRLAPVLAALPRACPARAALRRRGKKSLLDGRLVEDHGAKDVSIEFMIFVHHFLSPLVLNFNPPLSSAFYFTRS